MLSKDETLKLAQNYAEKGFLCSESVLLAISKSLSISSELIPKIATGFGAGIGRHGEVCGALAGGVMALGLKFGRSTLEPSKPDRRPHWFAQELANQFQVHFGNIRCRDLLGLDLSRPEDVQKYTEKQVWNTRCRSIILDTCSLVHEFLQSHQEQ
jgi:C_GCAxxG_C_C family probable redox protein